MANARGTCFVLVTSSQNWAASATLCRTFGEGWDLAAPRAQLGNDIIYDLVVAAGLARVWIGGSDAAQEGLWRWNVDASAFWSGGPTSSGGASVGGAYANWANDQPNAGTGSNCTSLWGTESPGNGLWSDDGCSGSRPAVCAGPWP
jgi:hypothetical protein